MSTKKPYYFGKIREFDLEKIEQEVLNDNAYLEVFAGSETAFKKDIGKLSVQDAAPILKLNTYRYNYETQKFKDKKLPEGTQLGLMAEEVERFFPECIKEDQEGYRFVNYSMMVAPLIETVKHLEARIEELEKKLAQK